MNVKKQAAKDAFEYARAQMSVGEGAGNRRKLIMNQVASRTERVNGYHEAFTKAFKNQNMAKHAQAARKEAKRLGLVRLFDKNFRGLATGNKKSMSTPVILLASAAYFAHKRGLDKKIYAVSKDFFSDVRTNYRETKAGVPKAQRSIYKNRSNVTHIHNVTHIPEQRSGR